ncbi:AGAP007785-PA-like protein [Anopheles sinensis]|uniref:AGAP007785-PA-like protein n=1 Tax=Anopheles sinensis TaxID=74873 RepID=A0A084VI49_ANOSI|nr:AGAP007785-PA-like protein [Anopheles sinensis]
MAIPYRNTVLYTPCHCAIGKQLEGEQDAAGKQKRKLKRYKTSRRIQYLAKPRKPHRKYQPQPVQRFATCTEVCRPYNEPFASKRLQQLAEPHLPDPSELKGMTPAEWQQHRDWLIRNAQPKQPPATEQPKRDRKPLAALLNRIENLAAPRSTRSKFGLGKEQKVPAASPAAMKATPTEHVVKLAEPIARRRRAKGPIVEETGVPERALKAQASSRVVELAVAKRYTNVNNEYRDNPFTVEPNALRAKASERILELAKPKKVKK